MKRLFYIQLLFFSIILSSCNIGYYFELSSSKTDKITQKDKDLLLMQNEYRKRQSNGSLNSSNGLFVIENLSGYMIVEGSTAYIGFIGSDQVADFYCDFAASMVTPDIYVGSNSKVHGGLYSLFVKCRTTVNSWALDQQNNNGITDFVVMGHSMGGGLAVLVAAELEVVLDASSTLYCQSSGSPRVGNSTFVNLFNSNVTCSRIVNGSDQVPSVPYKNLGFRHVGTLYRIGPQPNALLAATGGWISQHLISSYAYSINENL